MERELSFVGHLEELRRRIIISLIALGLGSIISLPFAQTVLRILKAPAAGYVGKLAYFSPQDAFLIYMRIGFMCGLLISFPVIAYQFWAFIAPAISDRYKKSVNLFFISCVTVFALGASFAYFILIPKALVFLLGFGTDELQPVISATNYVSFVTSIILCCGLIFQMPILSFILSKVGLVNARMLRKKFPIAIVVIAVIAAIITPTVDAFNMMLLVIPMLLLYEVSIWISALAGRRQAPCRDGYFIVI